MSEAAQLFVQASSLFSYSRSLNDNLMERHTRRTLKSVETLCEMIGSELPSTRDVGRGGGWGHVPHFRV